MGYFAQDYWMGSASGGGSGFSIATPPTPGLSSRIPLRPTFTQKVTGKCRYRPFVSTVVNDYLFGVNGWDQPFYFSGTHVGDLGSTEPTTGAAAVAGASGWLANGATADYYLVWRNSTLKKETAPHAVTVTNSSGGTRDVTVTWTDPAITDFDKARLYRKLAGTGTYVFLADVAIATATYSDTSTDAAITSNTAYVRRYRTTKPPVFSSIASHANRLFFATGKDALLWIGPAWRTDGEFTMDDLPGLGADAASDSTVLPIAPNDGYGPITAIVTYFEALYVFKRNACYRITGRTLATFAHELVFSDRGCIAQRSIRVVQDLLYFLDARGILRMDVNGTLSQPGAEDMTQESPLAPTWARLNLDAMHAVCAEVDEEGGHYLLAVPLDDDPVPLYVVPFDYRRNRYVSLDNNVCALALGRLLDASGVQHLIALDDLGDVHEHGIGNSDIAPSGTLTGTITGNTALGVLTASAASFYTTSGGLAGAPFERYSSAGAVLDQNRVAANTGTTVTLLYYSAEAVTNASDQFGVGVIPARFRSGSLDFGDARRKKKVASMVVNYELNATSTIKVEGAKDSEDDVLLKEFALSATSEKQLVPVRQWGFSWAFQISNRNAGEGWTVSTVDVEVTAGGDRD